MPRDRPRRASHASTGSYTSFFGEGSDHDDARSSPATTTSPSDASLSPRPARPTAAARATTTLSSSSSSRKPPSTASTSKASAKATKTTRDRATSTRRALEQRLETLYQSTPGPVHSLKLVDHRARAQLEIDLHHHEDRISLRSWWNTRQWQDKRKHGTVEPDASSDSTEDEVLPAVKTERPTLTKRVKRSKAVNAGTEPRPSPGQTFKKEPSFVEPPEFPALTELAPAPPWTRGTAQFSLSPLLPPPIHYRSNPGPPALRATELEPTHYSNWNDTYDLWSAAPTIGFPSGAPRDWTVPTRPVKIDTVIEFPVRTLVIGTWSRRAVVDPSELQVVYLAATDTIVFSTRHLELIYHVHLAVASVSSLVLFHSLAESRSVLLLYRDFDSDNDPSSSSHPPPFTLSSSSSSSAAAAAAAFAAQGGPYTTEPTTTTTSSTRIRDFTPNDVATRARVYALELTETSQVPSLLAAIDVARSSRPSSSSVVERLVVGPWDPDALTVEDLATGLSRDESAWPSDDDDRDGVGLGVGAASAKVDTARFVYRGDDVGKWGQELWARKWVTRE
ncbi:hypothetical protein JCM11491_000434 [Sporobolomyces phaffii]